MNPIVDNPTPNIKKRKLMIDTTFLFDQFSKRGIGRYGKEILKRIIEKVIEEDIWELHFIGFLNLNQNLIQLNLSQFKIESLLSKIHFHSLGEPYYSGIMNILRWYQYYRPIINNVKPDVFYAPHFERGLPSANLLSKTLIQKPATAVTAHDAIPIVTNTYSSKGVIANLIRGVLYRFLFSGVRKSDLILTDSDYSRNDLIKYGKVPSEKIFKIYLGVEESFFKTKNIISSEEMSTTLKTYNLTNKSYFFYDAGLEANKAIPELLDIFFKLNKTNNKEIPGFLVITGGDFHKGIGDTIKARTKSGNKVLKQIKKKGFLNSIITTDKLSNDDLEILLFNSTAYLNLSRYEGFSLGPVQAMAAGIPSIVSNSSCTPEITQGGAFLVDTYNLDETSAKIIEFLTDKLKVNEFVKKGIEIANQYKWEKTVSETLRLINSLVLI